MNRRDFIKTTLTATAAAAGAALLGNPLLRAVVNKENPTMQILVLTGSPRRNGNSNTLADHFIRGAEEAGHRVIRFDAAFRDVHPCTGCNHCGMNGPCVFRDDFESIREPLVAADAVVFATPMYYFGVSAQLKAVIDRFYALNGRIHVPKKAALLMTYADNSSRKEQPIVNHYEVLLGYLDWRDAGRVIAPGVWPVGAIANTRFPEQAYHLGKTI